MPTRTSIILTIVAVIAAILVACGPSPTGETELLGESPGLIGSGGTPALADNADDSGGLETETPEPGDGPAPATNDTGEVEFSYQEDSLETDGKGLTVGFTQEGFPFRGEPDAPVVMEEYSDYQCPFCGRFVDETLPSVEENQIANGEVVLVFYDFPLTSIHPQAMTAHQAAYCAGEAGAAAYWEMHDTLFANINEWSGSSTALENFVDYAVAMGFDDGEFTECVTSNKYEARVQNGLDLGRSRGVNSTPSFFLNNQSLTGAQPLEVFNDAIVAVREGRTIASSAPADPQAPAAIPTPASFSDEHAAAMGNPDAPVTIVEFTDYQCPFCARHVETTLPQLIARYIEAGEVYYIMKDFPIASLHPNAHSAAEAARCAGEQDAYWEMHDALFVRQPTWQGLENPRDEFINIAGELDLDADEIGNCLDSGRHADAVDANLAEGSALGVTGTPSFFINGYPVRGAQPIDLFDYAIDLAKDGELAEAYKPQPTQEAPAEPSGPVDVPTDNSYSIGDSDAPVTIIEYTDYQCPFCSRHFEETLPQIIENFVETGQVRYVFKDFPLTNIHPQATKAAEAARCAGEQEAYHAMHDSLFARQSEWGGRTDAAELFVGYAEDLDLDAESFAECLESGRMEDAVMADLREGVDLGVRGTPTFFINGYYLSGAQPYSVFEQAITELGGD